MFPENKTLIDTLRIKGAAGSAPALRLSLFGMLAGADLRPECIPPSAVLIVRNLADPLPGHLKMRGVKVDPGWEQAVQDSLTRMYRTAARPAKGYIPSDAKAVLFADEGEMLACLALDMSRKEAAGRWWWKAVLKDFPSGGLRTLLGSRAYYVPAVLHHLSEWGQAVTVVSALSREEVMTVISAVNRVYGLKEPERERTDASPLLQFKVVEPPWRRWLLSVPHLSKEREYLIGLGLSLYHGPAAVKTNDFLRDLRKWLVYRDSISVGGDRFPVNQTSPVRITGPDHEDDAVRKTEREKDNVPARPGAKELAKVPPISSFLKDSASSETGDLSEDKLSPVRITGPDHEDDAVRKKVPEKDDVPARPASKEVEKVSPVSSFQREGIDEAGYHDTSRYIPDDIEIRPMESVETIRRRTDDVKERSAESVEQKEKRTGTDLQNMILADPEKEQHLKPESACTIPEQGVFTRLGGILYLINMMRHLDLPACFEEEWGLASQMGSWGVLEVLARVLAGEEDLSHDPLWNILAELGGREPGELPGETFCGSESFHLPVSWFNSDERTYYLAADSHRLRLWSEACLLVECQRDDSAPLVQAREELGRYLDNSDSVELSSRPFEDAPVENSRSPMIDGLNPELARWLSMVMPYIRYRLRSALGQVTSEYPEREILHVQGKLYVTSTHMDLVMSMEDISMPVRLTGLDRDPGWLPDFGRVVQFHFEYMEERE